MLLLLIPGMHVINSYLFELQMLCKIFFYFIYWNLFYDIFNFRPIFSIRVIILPVNALILWLDIIRRITSLVLPEAVVQQIYAIMQIWENNSRYFKFSDCAFIHNFKFLTGFGNTHTSVPKYYKNKDLFYFQHNED